MRRRGRTTWEDWRRWARRSVAIPPVLWLALLGACGGKGGDSSASEMAGEDGVMAPADAGDAGGMSAEEGKDGSAASSRRPVHLTGDQERALGILYTTVGRESLTRTIRTVGRIDAAEPDVSDVTLKIDGFVERLFVSTTGESVRRGQPLLALYSPALVAAQEELLTAVRLAGGVDSTAREAWSSARAMLSAARRRLTYWDITPEQIERLERTGEVTKTLTVVAPVSGIVLEKDVLEGQRVMPGMRLYRLADLSGVWVEGEVFEQDLQFVREGAQAHIEVAAYPGEHRMGVVSFVYPTVDERSRTNRVRVTVPNPDLRLKPGMFATVFFDARLGSEVLTVPMRAVVATGKRNLVFIRDSSGMLRPREVVLGPRAGEKVTILEGLSEGETIVESANFLVDAESRLAGTGGGMPGMQHGGGSAAKGDGGEESHDD